MSGTCHRLLHLSWRLPSPGSLSQRGVGHQPSLASRLRHSSAATRIPPSTPARSRMGSVAEEHSQQSFLNGKGPDEGVEFTQIPHPDWQPGEKQPNPWNSTRMLSVDPEEIGGSAVYPLVISAVVPRPIAFICSQDAEGRVNLSPYSYFNAVAHDPPILVVGHSHASARPHGRKDSLNNILETKEFTVNIISEWFLEAANHTCGPFDPDVDEMALAGLTPVASERVGPPRVGESAVQMECKLHGTYEVHNSAGELTTTLVMGQVVLFHVLEEVAAKSPSGKTIVDIAKYRPMSRLGGNFYGCVTKVFELARPDKAAQQRLKADYDKNVEQQEQRVL